MDYTDYINPLNNSSVADMNDVYNSRKLASDVWDALGDNYTSSMSCVFNNRPIITIYCIDNNNFHSNFTLSLLFFDMPQVNGSGYVPVCDIATNYIDETIINNCCFLTVDSIMKNVALAYSFVKTGKAEEFRHCVQDM